jgi:hypothetical protein
MITLSFRDDPPGIAVSVSDRGRALPRLPSSQPDDTAMSGRGLLIVDALATAWGVTPMDPPPGKTVWFRLAPKSRP